MLYFFLGEPSRAVGGLKGPEDLLGARRVPAESTWMGIYLGGSKVGYVHSELEPLPDGGYEIRESSRMSGAMMGAEQLMKMEMEVKTDSTLALVSFTGSLDASPYATAFSGERSNQVLSIKLTTGGKTSERYIPAPEPIYLSQSIKPLLQAGRLGAGDSLKLSSFDPTGMEMQDLIIFGGNLQKEQLFGQPVMARKLVTRMGEFISTLFVDAEGNSIVEYGPLGIVLKREDMATALAMDDGAGSVDFLDIFAVKPTGKILNDSRSVVKARYRISGIVPANIEAASARQRFDSDGILVVDATVISIESTLPDPAFSKDAPFIESRDPAIIKAAKEAVEGGVDRLDSLERLSNWVYRYIAKRPSAGLPSALAILQTKRGDCNEHSVFFTALARSLGIPCKIELGVVYQEGRFYYHAWPAAMVEGRWVEFEPTFGDRRADAARIALAAGDMSTASKLATIIGNLKIEIVEAN